MNRQSKDASCSHSEQKETPAKEASMHSKKFLSAALRKKSTGGTTYGQGIANAGGNSGAGGGGAG